MPENNFPQHNLELNSGHRLVVYTDGITEAINGEQQLFGEERLAEACLRNFAVPLKTMVESVFTELDAFLDGEP